MRFLATFIFLLGLTFSVLAQRSEVLKTKQLYDARIKDYEILTPKAPLLPKINGAKIYGVRPGKEFVYRIPCQGARPLRFSVTGLPAGLKLDDENGIITGITPNEKGEYKILFNAENQYGKAKRQFKLVIGDKIGLTPPTGWNSWGGHMMMVSDQIIRKAADVFVEKGLADVGFQYISIDDCWMRMSEESYLSRSEGKKKQHEGYDYKGMIGPVRDSIGNIICNANFPNMKVLTDYIHHYGLKAGIYSSPGQYTCQIFAGSYGHEKQDAAQYAKWGFDLLKYDLCLGTTKLAELKKVNPDYKQLEFWKPMARYLQDQNRDIFFNLCQYGEENPWLWAPSLGISSWRIGGDLNHHVEQYFDQAMRIASELRDYNKPGQWSDPDYIYINKIRDYKKMVNPTAAVPLNSNQQYQYVTLWSILCAPFFFSFDINEIDEFTIGLMANPDVFNINQDELGNAAKIIRKKNEEVVMVKTLSDGSSVLAIFNTDSSSEKEIEIDLVSLGIKRSKTFKLYDVWRQKKIGQYKDRFTAKLSANGVGLFIVSR